MTRAIGLARLAAGVVAGLVGGLAATSASAQVTFTRLGLPPGIEPQNPAFTDAYGVANDGTVVGSMYVPNVGFRAFRWTAAGGLQQVDGISGNSQVFARAITPDGSITVGENTSPQVGYRQLGSGTLQSLSFPQTGEYDASGATDVSDNGGAISGLLSRVDDGTFRAGRWTVNGGWQNLGLLDPANDYESSANTISGDGRIVAGYSVGTNFKAFRWSEATQQMSELVNPFGSGLNATAIAMSMSGDVIAGTVSDGSSNYGMIWRGNGTSLVLGQLAGYDSAAAYAISGDGNLIAGATGVIGLTDRAVFWNAAGQITDLQDYLTGLGIDLTGWSLTAITEISQNGQWLTGRGINPTGDLESFVVQIPAPSATLVPVLGLIVAARRRR